MKNNKITKLLGRVTAAATIVSMFATVSPALGAEATSMSDTLSRQMVSTSATHTLVATFPSGTWDNTETVTFDYSTPSFALVDSTPACSLSTGNTCTAAVDASTDVVTLTCTQAGGCSGVLTLAAFTGTNPGSAGSKKITLAGTGGIDGQFAVAISDDDQVTISATVDPMITFDLDTAETDTESASAYAVTLDTLTPGVPKSSGDTSNVEFIWTDLTTNAEGGAIVTVKNANGGNGLVSASVSGDDIDSANGTMAAATENYGLCVENATYAPTASQGSYAASSPFSNAGCDDDSTDNVVGGLTTSAQTILNSATDPILAGRAAIVVNANANGLTRPHDDYADTLTFVATATF